MYLTIPRNEAFASYDHSVPLTYNIHKLYLTRNLALICPKINGDMGELSHGRVINTQAGLGLVVGTFGDKLWVQLESDFGRVSYWKNINAMIAAGWIHVTPVTGKAMIISYYDFMTLVYYTNKFPTRSLMSFRGCCFPKVKNIFAKSLKELKKRRRVNPVDTLSLLPSEMVAEIANHLPPIYVFHLSFMCKSWYQLFRNPLIWKRFCEKYGIVIDRNILQFDYKDDIVNYFFYYGINRMFWVKIHSADTLKTLHGRKLFMGSLYWRLSITDEILYISLLGLNVLSEFETVLDVKYFRIGSPVYYFQIKIEKPFEKYPLLTAAHTEEPFVLILSTPVKLSLVYLLHSLDMNV